MYAAVKAKSHAVVNMNSEGELIESYDKDPHTDKNPYQTQMHILHKMQNAKKKKCKKMHILCYKHHTTRIFLIYQVRKYCNVQWAMRTNEMLLKS